MAVSTHSAMIALVAVCGLVSVVAVALRLSRPDQDSALLRLHRAASESRSRLVEQWKWRLIANPRFASMCAREIVNSSLLYCSRLETRESG